MSTVSSSIPNRTFSWTMVYTGVALTTMATLMLELALTRIFSVVFFYHFAFLAISIALFGLGVGGVVSYFFTRRGTSQVPLLAWLSAGNAVMVVVSLFIIVTASRGTGFWNLAAVYFAAALPFLLAGIIVSIAISETIERINRVYFADLAGAAVGCLLLIPFLNTLGGIGTVLSASVLFAASSAVWFGLAQEPGRRLGAVGLALALVLLIVANSRVEILTLSHAKGRVLAEEVMVRWNSFSRIAVTEDKDKNRTIVIDGDATTGIARFDFNNLHPNEVRDLTQQGPGLPYALRPGAKTLIIGAGGGWDVSRALVSGSKDITGVEINPIIANTIMRQQHPDWSNRLYLRPEVRIVVEDGRSFVRRNSEKYQVIQATLVDTWASTAAGAFALSENNLYTTEAFKDYLSHLTDDGLLAFTRWGFEPPRESLRLISLAAEALNQLGESDVRGHFVVIREGGKKALEGWGALDTVVISRKRLTEADLRRAREVARAAGFEILYLPGTRQENEFQKYLDAPDRRAFERNYQFDISPVGDNRPFFFYTVQPRDLIGLKPTESSERADYKVNLAVPTLFELLAVSIIATVLVLLLPPVLLGSRLPKQPGASRFLLYFACLGAGYILVQVGLIQKLVLFLGRPTYALTVVIFTMLLASGIGSWLSARVVRGDKARLRVALLTVAALVAVLALVVSPITTSGVGWPLPLKVLVTVLLITPAALLMGMPFPSGLGLMEAWHKPSVRWAWAMNAAASVLGSAGAIFLAIYVGLQLTVLAGALLYAVAAFTLKAIERPAVI